MLLISGAMDPVGNYGKGIRMIEKQLLRAGVSDLTVWIYPGARHELLNETNRDEVMREDVYKRQTYTILSVILKFCPFSSMFILVWSIGATLPSMRPSSISLSIAGVAS